MIHLSDLKPFDINYRFHFPPDLSLLYVEIPKTGCTTLKTAIANQFGLIPEAFESTDGIHDYWQSAPNKWSALDDAQRGTLITSHDVLRFTSVRNPYERALSCYLDKCIARRGYHFSLLFPGEQGRGQPSFMEFLKAVERTMVTGIGSDIHWRPMTDLCKPKTIRYDHIVRFERFEESYAELRRRLGWGPKRLPIPTFKTKAAQQLKNYIGPHEVDAIRRLYREDFSEFGYSTCLSAAIAENEE